eukprot:12171115-Alexandrium_andersonii.AAC.1
MCIRDSPPPPSNSLTLHLLPEHRGRRCTGVRSPVDAAEAVPEHGPPGGVLRLEQGHQAVDLLAPDGRDEDRELLHAQ